MSKGRICLLSAETDIEQLDPVDVLKGGVRKSHHDGIARNPIVPRHIQMLDASEMQKVTCLQIFSQREVPLAKGKQVRHNLRLPLMRVFISFRRNPFTASHISLHARRNILASSYVKKPKFPRQTSRDMDDDHPQE